MQGEALLATLNQRLASSDVQERTRRSQYLPEESRGDVSLILPGFELDSNAASRVAFARYTRADERFALILPGFDLNEAESERRDEQAEERRTFAREEYDNLNDLNKNSYDVLGAPLDDPALVSAIRLANVSAASDEPARLVSASYSVPAPNSGPSREELDAAAEKERAEREAAEKAAKEQAEREAAEKAANERTTTAQVQPNVTANAETSNAEFVPFIITGFENFNAPPFWAEQPSVNTDVAPTNWRPAVDVAPNQSEPGTFDDRDWLRLDERLQMFFADLTAGATNDDDFGEVDDALTLDGSTIIRAQDGFSSYEPTTERGGGIPSYETSRQNAANDVTNAAQLDEAYKRAQQVAELYFAPMTPQTDERTGASERKLSLRDAALRITATPDARFQLAKAYWELQGAFAELRVENLVYSQYLEAYNQTKNELIRSRALGAQARLTEARARTREAQLRLLRVMGVSPGYGYPVPTTIPFCGKKFDLGTPRVFNAHMTRAGGMIEERLRSSQELSQRLNAPQNQLKLDLSQSSDPQTPIAALENQRELVLSYARLVVDLNLSIAEYVAYFPANVSNERFVQGLSCKDAE